MAKILSLTARLGLDGSGFQKGMDKAKEQASNLKTVLAGAFASIGMAALIKDTISYAGEIGDLAERLDIIPEKLQEMQYWASQNASSVEDLSAAFDALEKSRKAALEGDQGKVAAFGRMGIAPNQIGTLGPADMMSQLNKSAMKLGMAGSRSDLMEILGKSASKMAFAMQNSMDEAAESARNAGAVIRNEVIFELARMDDIMSQFAMTLKASLAPAIFYMMGLLEKAVITIKGYGSYVGGASSAITSGETLKSGFASVAKFRGGIAEMEKTDPIAAGIVKYGPLMGQLQLLFQLVGEMKSVHKEGKKASEPVFQSFEEEVIKRAKDLADKLSGVGRGAATTIAKPSMLGTGMISGGKMRNTIESDAFAKIGGFVGTSGSVNHLKESADANKALLALARGQGIKTVIKE